jgi:hypothetical protein
VSKPPVPPPPLRDEAGSALLAECGTGPAAFQVWRNDTPGPQFLQNEGSSLCLNVDGCGGAGSSVITYTCITEGNTCPNGGVSNLQWVLDANAHIVSSLNGLCVEANNASLLFLAPCTDSSPQQAWHFGANGTIVHSASGLCLSTPPPLEYAQICGRIAALNGFAQTMTAYCLRVSSVQYQVLLFNNDATPAVLSNGSIPDGAWQPSADGAWIQLQLAFNGSAILPSIAGQSLPAAHDATIATGNAALGCGWHTCAFDLFNVQPTGT